jgi:glycine cleavage system H protein
LDKTPETVNQAPYGEGWMLKVKPAAAGEEAGLLDAAAYRAAIG